MGLDRRLDFSAPVTGADRQGGDHHLAGVSELRRVGQRRHHQHLSLLRCCGHQRKIWLVVNPHRSRLTRERARCPRLFGAENRKPTIAQWSVFLPRLGRARRQASPTILSLPGPSWTGNFARSVAPVPHYLTASLSCSYSGRTAGLESPRLAQATEALGADHQVIEDFHSE